MIPSIECDPKINVVYIGGQILITLKDQNMYIDDLINTVTQELKVSIDHVILSLDWLHIISAIQLNENMVFISETRNS
jgi:hypothetical protein